MLNKLKYKNYEIGCETNLSLSDEDKVIVIGKKFTEENCKNKCSKDPDCVAYSLFKDHNNLCVNFKKCIPRNTEYGFFGPSKIKNSYVVQPNFK